jgi:DNA-binding response OmpR family regulator
VARILIAEPEPDLRSFAEQAVLELGHEPLLLDPSTAGARVDVLLLAVGVEAVATASALRRRDHALPIVCMGTQPADATVRALRPVAYLVKPFRLADLARALSRALGT